MAGNSNWLPGAASPQKATRSMPSPLKRPKFPPAMDMNQMAMFKQKLSRSRTCNISAPNAINAGTIRKMWNRQKQRYRKKQKKIGWQCRGTASQFSSTPPCHSFTVFDWLHENSLVRTLAHTFGSGVAVLIYELHRKERGSTEKLFWNARR